MAKVIAAVSGKGGVGKTTVACNVGIKLAGMGHKVLLLDADVGLRNLDIALGIEEAVLYDFVDFIQGRCTMEQAIMSVKNQPWLYFLPGCQSKSDESQEQITPEKMSRLYDDLKGYFEYIIVDTPTGIDGMFRNAVSGVDGCIVVTVPSFASVRDADRVIGLLETSGINEMYLVINRIRLDMIKQGKMLNLDDIIEILGIDTIGLVPEDDNILAVSGSGRDRYGAMDSYGFEAFLNIARRLCGEVVPIVDFDRKESVLSKVKSFVDNLFVGGYEK